jgi:hypothetical protein
MTTELKKTLIGRKDIADFEELNLYKIPVKIDTGANTGAIHCHKVDEIVHNGEKAICFYLLDPQHKKYKNEAFYTSKFRKKTIRSSNGQKQDRYIIQTTITLFGNKYPVELSLSNRGKMKYPVLMGRKFLKGRFVVDVGLSNISHTQNKQKYTEQ